jgi:hypothetical protein
MSRQSRLSGLPYEDEVNRHREIGYTGSRPFQRTQTWRKSRQALRRVRRGFAYPLLRVLVVDIVVSIRWFIRAEPLGTVLKII